MGTLRLGDPELPGQSHVTERWRGWDLNLGLLVLRANVTHRGPGPPPAVPSFSNTVPGPSAHLLDSSSTLLPRGVLP